MSLTLSLITTTCSNIKLITKSKSDAQEIVKNSDLLSSKGDFESLDFQFSITEKEFNSFDRFSGASYKAVEDEEWETIGGIDFIMTSKEKGVEDNIVAKKIAKKYEDDLFDTDTEFMFENDSDDILGFGGIGVDYNSDEQNW